MDYVRSTPRVLPAGRIIVHNDVRSTNRIGSRGFRVWLDVPRPGYRVTVCQCGWAPHLPKHYRTVLRPR